MCAPMLCVLLAPFLAAMFLAINMGGSGTAPSFSAAYGARLTKEGRIPGLFVAMSLFLFAIVGGRPGTVIYHYVNPFGLISWMVEQFSIAGVRVDRERCHDRSPAEGGCL